MEVAVAVSRLSKNYPLSGSQFSRLRRLFGPGAGNLKDGLWALRDVTFTVNRGEAFGIIGANGSGKSTLLQIVAGILRPTAGSVEVQGRMSALLELGSGFSPEFTGRDNVYLNGSLLGLSNEEIDARFGEIERFAEIGEFIDQPTRTYSTGMVLRLAFAVAAHVDPEILIVDEALAVGDMAFRQRCMRRIHDLRARGATILFVSHEASDVKALCDRCLWLRNGIAEQLGETDEVVAKYLSAALHKQATHKELHHEADNAEVPPHQAGEPLTGFGIEPRGHRFGDGRATIVGAALTSPSGEKARELTPRQRMVLRMGFRVNARIESPILGFLVRNSRGENIFGSNTARENYPLAPLAAGEAHNIEMYWSPPGLAPGEYRISLAVADGNIEQFAMCDYVEDALRVDAAGAGERGYFDLRCASVGVQAE